MLSRAIGHASERVAGFFGTEGDYEKAYVPWDELMEKMILQNPERWTEDDLVLQSDWQESQSNE